MRVDASIAGAWGGAALWATELCGVALLNAGVGGWSVLAESLPALAGWGFGYVGLGALFGLALGRAAAAGWIAVWLVGDVGVLPGAAHAGLLVAPLAVGWLVGRGGEAWRVRALAGLGCVGLGWGALVCLPRGATLVGRGDAPDVVLIVVDTLRADHVGSWGYARDTTPAIDRLAADGVRFTGARATSSWTLPSHASLFTGALPSAHGAVEGSAALDDRLETLAEALRARGHATLGLSANAWVSSGTGLDRGFDDFRFLGDRGFASQLLLPLAVSAPVDLGGEAIADAAIDALRLTDGPIFLFANLLEAHEPLGELPRAFRSRFGAVPAGVGRTWIRDMPRFWCACAADAGALACRDGLFRADRDRVAQTIDLYDAGIRYADHQIGRVLDALARRARPAIVVVTSDHGELLGESDRLGHMVWLEDALLDVPLVVRAPGLSPGVDAEPISLADVPGLVLALVDGREPPPRSPPIAESHPHAPGTRQLWTAAFGCDFSPTAIPRRSVRLGDVHLRWQGGQWDVEGGGPLPAARPALDAPFAGGERAWEPSEALEALGYLAPSRPGGDDATIHE